MGAEAPRTSHGLSKTRRSRPVGHVRNPFDDTIEAVFCFMWVKVEQS